MKNVRGGSISTDLSRAESIEQAALPLKLPEKSDCDEWGGEPLARRK